MGHSVLLSPLETAEIIEFGEGEAWASWFSAAPPGLDLRVKRIGGAIALCAPDHPLTLVNRVIGLGLRQPATREIVQECLEFYRTAGSGVHAMQICPQAQPPELPDWLAAGGLQHSFNTAKMIRPAAEAAQPPTSLQVRQIDQRQAEDWAEVLVTVFELPGPFRPWMAAAVSLPGWFHYLAYAEEQPVAAGALFVKDGVGWLGAGSTLPAYRRRGGQGTIMARRISDAAGLGCRWVVTETGEDTPEKPNPSYRNMLRSGFNLAYLRAGYLPASPEQQ